MMMPLRGKPTSIHDRGDGEGQMGEDTDTRFQTATTARPLVISPNVKALLEHDERIRAAISPFSIQRSASPELNSPFATTTPRQASLPPPPRGLANKGLFTTRIDTQITVPSTPPQGAAWEVKDPSSRKDPSTPFQSALDINETDSNDGGRRLPNPFINYTPILHSESPTAPPRSDSPSGSIRLRHKLYSSSLRQSSLSLNTVLPEIVPSPSLSESMASPQGSGMWWSPSSPIERDAANSNRPILSPGDEGMHVRSVSHSSLSAPTSPHEAVWSPPSTAGILDTPIASRNPFRASLYSQVTIPHSPLEFAMDKNIYSNTRPIDPKSAISPDRESFIDLGVPNSPKAGTPIVDESLETHQALQDAQPDIPSISPNLFETKPPIPTTPKPTSFRIPQSSSRAVTGPLPVHNLTGQERAERVKQTRKLAQVFGRPPAGIFVLDQNPGTASTGIMSKLLPRHTHQRAAASMFTEIGAEGQANGSLSDRPILSSTSRRHSSPLNPEFAFLVDGRPLLSPTSQTEDNARVDLRRSSLDRHCSASSYAEDVPDSPTSFIEMSDEDVPACSALGKSWPFTEELEMTKEEGAEEERRRKREKLAKLHRFLGSRVPVDAVVGSAWDATVSLPPLKSPTSPVVEEGEEGGSVWIRRRRRSSFSAGSPTHWDDDIDRLKEDLNGEEKAINVRRAVKMEKMFGELPPQVLYHTRPAHVHAASTSPSNPSSPALPPLKTRNANQSSYLKGKGKKTHQRPGTAESERALLEQARLSDSGTSIPSEPHTSYTSQNNHDWSTSDVYMHFRTSLLSLKDIIDRDDRQSLADLHEFMTGEEDHPALLNRRDTVASLSSRSSRRRSLPPRASNASLASQFTLPAQEPEAAQFQVRRRRAAKLQQFFGVQYRDLFGEVLDSLERGVEEESRRGSLRIDEYQDLVQKLRKLKMRTDDL